MEFCEAGKNWYEIECVVGNRHGLHARPSMDIVTASEEYNGVQSTDICHPLNPLTKIKINLSRSFIF